MREIRTCAWRISALRPRSSPEVDIWTAIPWDPLQNASEIRGVYHGMFRRNMENMEHHSHPYMEKQSINGFQ